MKRIKRQRATALGNTTVENYKKKNRERKGETETGELINKRVPTSKTRQKENGGRAP